MEQNFGIDKIILTTPEFMVKNLKSGNFGIDTSIKQGGGEPPVLITDLTGNKVEAWKAYHNSNIANYTISKDGLLVSFNPSKLFHPYNLVATGTKQYDQSLKKVSDELSNLGISCNFGEMKPCRIDVAAQQEMKYPLFQYQSAFRLLKGQRMKNQREYEGGYLIGNTQNQTMFYDKQKELKYQKMEAIMQGEKNLLRGEIRQLNSKSVGSIFNILTFNDFSKIEPGEIKNIYKSFLNKRIFSRQYISDQLSFDFHSELEILKSYKTSNPKKAWQLYIMETSIDMMLLKHGSIDNFGEFLMMAGYDRTRAYRIKNEVKTLLSKKSKHDLQKGEVTAATLLAELKDKFAG